MTKIRMAVRSLAAAALAAAGTTLAHAQGYGPGMMGGYGWGGGWGFGAIGMVLWWILIVLGIVLLARWLLSGSPRRGEQGSTGRALDILKERYARGEIDKQEYEEKKRDLQ
ncbi:MAG: SHOCT domain-containing protein [Burkholderiales bacterium]